jgi:hypothetical protein
MGARYSTRPAPPIGIHEVVSMRAQSRGFALIASETGVEL